MQTLVKVKRSGWVAAGLKRTSQFTRVVTQNPRLYSGFAKTGALQQAEVASAASVASSSLHPSLMASHYVPSQHRPQLNIVEQRYKPGYHQAIAEIMKLREKYMKNRAIFVEGEKMIPLLKALGARDEDFAAIQTVSDNLKGDPTLPFRLTRNGRFCFDFDTHTIRRLEFQPFVLSVEEDFSRYDSSQIRHFDEIENELQLNTVCQALFVFKAILFHNLDTKPRAKLDYSGNKFVCTLFSVRTFTNSAILGEPALEGVHTDGVDHTMTTFLGAENMSSDSAVTYLHAMDETTGVKIDEVLPSRIRDRAQHRHFLDTMVFVDTENKHSVTTVYPIDASKEARRDMLVFFTRKPVTKDHISVSVDSVLPHQELPMEIPLFVPQTAGNEGN